MLLCWGLLKYGQVLSEHIKLIRINHLRGLDETKKHRKRMYLFVTKYSNLNLHNLGKRENPDSIRKRVLQRLWGNVKVFKKNKFPPYTLGDIEIEKAVKNPYACGKPSSCTPPYRCNHTTHQVSEQSNPSAAPLTLWTRENSERSRDQCSILRFNRNFENLIVNGSSI